MNKQTTLHSLLQDKCISQAIADTESAIRTEPVVPEHRWLLFQLLCLTGNWTRALTLLTLGAQAVAPGKAGAASVMLLYQQLIDAEQARGKVFAGLSSPTFFSQAPTWVLSLVEALAIESLGDQEAADKRRESALAAAPSVKGRTQMGSFEWFADADSRLGPVFELMHNGQYFWVPMSDVSSVFMPEPNRIVDLVWTPVSLSLTNGQVLQGHMPARYVGSEEASDAARLGRETLWREQGRTGTFGIGQKMWMHNAGDCALHDVRECHFDVERAQNDA